MHGGRIGECKEGEGVKKTKISGCDKEHEEHEMLVKHFKVRCSYVIISKTFCCVWKKTSISEVWISQNLDLTILLL